MIVDRTGCALTAVSTSLCVCVPFTVMVTENPAMAIPTDVNTAFSTYLMVYGPPTTVGASMAKWMLPLSSATSTTSR